MRNFIDPYSPIEFEVEILDSSIDLCDSSGYLTLQDQISIITNQSELNNEFRRGMIDNYNDYKREIYNSLLIYEDNDFVISQLSRARSGDLIDKETLLDEAYKLGYDAGFFRHEGREPVEPEPSTLSGGDGKDEPAAE